MFGIVLQDLPDFPNRAVDAVVDVEVNLLPPNPLDDLLPRDQLPAVLGEEQQNLHGNALQLERLAGASELVGAGVELEAFAKLESVLWVQSLFPQVLTGTEKLREP